VSDAPSARSLAAVAARASGLFDLCVEKDAASLALEPKTTTLVHLAGCADRVGEVLLALRKMQEVLDRAIEHRDAEVASLARQRVERLLASLSTLVLVPPATEDVHGLAVTVDEAAIPSDRLGKPLLVDPGAHRVRATGLDGTMPVFYDEIATLERGRRVTFGPHGRLHVQSGANFFHRVYHAEVTPIVSVPVFRTTDRELGPLHAYTFGGMIWWRIRDDDAPRLLLYLSADALYTQYHDSLYVRSRLAGYGTLGLEAEFE
jgi:hypothetical protein